MPKLSVIRKLIQDDDCLLDPLWTNIPENAALGITLAAGGAINIAFLVAIFVSNLPEGLASTNDLKSSGLSRKYIIVLWSVAIVIGTIATTIGYGILSNASPLVISNQ
jgi:ZIP family zinc transporter